MHARTSVDEIPGRLLRLPTPGFLGNPVNYRVDGIPERSRLLRLPTPDFFRSPVITIASTPRARLAFISSVLVFEADPSSETE